MVEFDLRINPKQKTTYWPRQIVGTFGTQLKFLPNHEAGLIYRKGADPRRVLASLDVIRQDLQLRVNDKRNGLNPNLKNRGQSHTERRGRPKPPQKADEGGER